MADGEGRSLSLTKGHPRAISYAVALLVTVLWSSSYVLIKLGLKEVPPLYFATVRYGLAFAILAMVDLLSRGGKKTASGNPAPKPPSRTLIIAGVAGYTIAQGFQYVGLFFLPAVTTSLLLSFTPVFVIIIGTSALHERPSRLQILGLAVALLGAYLFFFERVSWQGEWLGMAVVLTSGVGWAGYVVMVRGLQKTSALSSLRLTTVTMGVGVVGMMVLSALTEEYATLTTSLLLVVVWLAAVNTALAFFLWNWVLKTLPAYELTVVQNLMLVEIALLAFLFLGETITLLMVFGMALVFVGVLAAQTRIGQAGLRR